LFNHPVFTLDVHWSHPVCAGTRNESLNCSQVLKPTS
jgi:hypothetical protein